MSYDANEHGCMRMSDFSQKMIFSAKKYTWKSMAPSSLHLQQSIDKSFSFSCIMLLVFTKIAAHSYMLGLQP